ncbi:hypothetical protein ACILG0_04970 [Pseudomonadota bacterium AL_CKDN230030165-1A_HGKHYDSX7]
MPQQHTALPTAYNMTRPAPARGPLARVRTAAAMAVAAMLASAALNAPAAAEPKLIADYLIDANLRAFVYAEPLNNARGEQRISVVAGDQAAQVLGVLSDEEIDIFDSPDLDRDGYGDFFIGQSGGSQNVITRLFRYRPETRDFIELKHPGGDASPCRGFVSLSLPEDPDEREFYGSCRYGAGAYGIERYSFAPDGTVRALQWQIPVRLDGMETTDVITRFNDDGTVAEIVLDSPDLALGPKGEVLVERLDLYDAPDPTRRSGQFVVRGDLVRILDGRPGWIKLGYRGSQAGAGDQQKWVRYDDMLFDKYAYAGPAKTPQALSLSVFDYFGKPGDELRTTFTLTVDNPGKAPVALQAPQIRLLFIDAKGNRTVHTLYEREPVTLGPQGDDKPARAGGRATGGKRYKPSATWDDNAVQWFPAPDGSRRYVIDNNGIPATFLPALAPGHYRMIAVLTDPALEAPVYANEVTFDYPLDAEQIEEPGENGG